MLDDATQTFEHPWPLSPFDPHRKQVFAALLEDQQALGGTEAWHENARAEISRFSSELAELVFSAVPEPVLQRIREAAGALRINICSERAEFHAVPWELLPIPLTDRLLSLTSRSFVRSASSRGAHLTVEQEVEELRLLYVLARSDELGEVAYDCVALPVMEAAIASAGALVVDMLRPPSLASLKSHLQAAQSAGRPYHAVHFDCHGSFRRGRSGQAAYLHLKNAENGVDLVAVESIVSACDNRGVSLLTFNCCETVRLDPAAAQDSVVQHLASATRGSVVAMSYKVTPATAGAFYRSFYSQVCLGDSDIVAATHARRAIACSNRASLFDPDALIPVVYSAAPTRLRIAGQGQSARSKCRVGPLSAAPLLSDPVIGPDLISALEQLMANDEPGCLSLQGIPLTEALPAVQWWLNAGKTSGATPIALRAAPPTDRALFDRVLAGETAADLEDAVREWLGTQTSEAELQARVLLDGRHLLRAAIEAGHTLEAILHSYHLIMTGMAMVLAREPGSTLILLDHGVLQTFPIEFTSVRRENATEDPAAETDWDGVLASLDRKIPLGAWLAACFSDGRCSSPQIGFVTGKTGLSELLPDRPGEHWERIFRLSVYAGLLQPVTEDLFTLTERGARFIALSASAQSDADAIRQAGRLAFLNYYMFLLRASERDARERSYFQRAAQLLAPGAADRLRDAYAENDFGSVKLISKLLLAAGILFSTPDLASLSDDWARRTMTSFDHFPDVNDSADFQISNVLTTAIALIRDDDPEAAGSRMQWLADALDRPDTAELFRHSYCPAVYHELGITLSMQGKLDDARRWLVKSLELELKASDNQNIARSYVELANLEQARLKTDAALNYYRKALTAVRLSGDAHGELTIRVDYGWLLLAANRPDAALDNAVELVSQAQAQHSRSYEVQGLIQLAEASIGTPAQARDWLQRAWRILDHLDDAEIVFNVRFNIGVVYLLLEDWAKGREIFEPLYREVRALGQYSKWSQAGHELAQAYRGLGLTEQASRLWAGITFEAGRRNDVQILVSSSLVWAALHLEARDRKRAGQILGDMLASDAMEQGCPAVFRNGIRELWERLRDDGGEHWIWERLGELSEDRLAWIEEILAAEPFGPKAAG